MGSVSRFALKGPCCDLGVLGFWGLGFTVWGLGVQGLRFGVWGLGFWGFSVHGLGFRVLGFGVQPWEPTS